MLIFRVEVMIPPKIAAKIASGEYELVGTVVREKATGRVIMWLKEKTSETTVQQCATQKFFDFDKSLPGASPLAVLQIFDTAITLAGFAMLSMKMDALSRQCDAILDRIGTIDHHLQWLRDAGVATIQAKMHAALEGAHTAHRLGQSVLPYDTAINEAALFFRRMLGTMMGRGDPARDAEMFDVLLTQHALAVLARARSHWLLLGPAAGLEALDQGRQAHVDLAATFQQTLRDTERGIALVLELTTDRRERLKTTATLFGYITHRLTERREELAGCVAAGLTAPADPETLRQLEALETACLVITPDTQTDAVPALT